MKVIQQGAEAKIILNNNKIIKNRIKKLYRLKEIDEKLIKQRTKAEAKIMEKLSKVINVPKILKVDKEKIEMEYIKGEKLSESFEKLDYKKIAKQIGESISKIHNLDIIHGDLTTSNMLIKNDDLYIIDFGLAFHSSKVEDKAVDLHLLKQALESKHYKIAEDVEKIILDNYDPKQEKEIKGRIKIIEKRGRYKDKY